MGLVRAPIFLRFLRRVHRRLVVVRLVEWCGAGLFAGCAAGAALIPALLWLGRPAWGAAGWATGVGVATGLAFGLGRRPRLLDAAMEADRQLRLADLLGTAWSLHRRGGGEPGTAPWAASVLAMADARCRGASPWSVALRRFGARAWGGIGLATALVLALASLSANPPDTRAGNTAPQSDVAVRRRAEAGAPTDRPVVSPWGTAARRRLGATEGTDERDRRRRNGTDVPVSEPDHPDDPAQATPPDSRRSASGAGGRGAGASQQADAGSVTAPRPPAAAPSGQSPRRTPVAESRQGMAGGDGRSAPQIPNPGTTSETGDGSTADPASAAEVQPWQSDSWPGDAARARAAVEAGRVPDAYRDLVRRYFDRP
jgi:hypothetical protein